MIGRWRRPLSSFRRRLPAKLEARCANRLKNKKTIYYIRLSSFDATVYCTAADKRLKLLRSFDPEQSEFGFAPELAHTIRIRTDSVSGAATRSAARVKTMFCRLEAGRATRKWESDECDFAN